MIALEQIPQFIVYKTKLLCAEYISQKIQLKDLINEAQSRKSFLVMIKANGIDYGNSL